MSTHKRNTFNDIVLNILQLCRKPRTLHYIKDNGPFNNERLKFYINKLVTDGLIIVNIGIKIGRGYKKQIITTAKGKELLKENGVMY